MPRLKGGKALVPIAIRVSSETELMLMAIKKTGVDINKGLRELVDAYVEGAMNGMSLADKEAMLAELNFGRVVDSGIKEKPTAESRFRQRLKEGNFEEFSGADWIRYFEMKSKEKNLVFYKHKFSASILKSAMDKYSPHLIKQMIDFIYESGQTEFDISQSPVMCLSKSWLAFTLNNSNDWAQGKYKSKADKKITLPKRESVGSRERKAKKSLGDGVDI